MCESRKGLFREEYGQEWATPVLYMRSHEGLLFDLQPGDAVKVDSRQRAAAEAERVAREAEAQRATARQAEAERAAAAERLAAAERERQAREKVERQVPAPVIVDAEVQAAALTEPTPSKRAEEAVDGAVSRATVVAEREQSKRTAPAAVSSGQAATERVSVSIPPAPARLHLPLWQVLLLIVPVAALALALSWHHLRPHSDDEHAAPAGQASVASTAPSVTPTVEKTPVASPAKAADKTPVPQSKAKVVSALGASEPDKAPSKSEGPAAAAFTPTATPAKTPAMIPATAPVASQPAASQPVTKTTPPPVAPKRLRMDAAQQLAKLVDRVNPTYPLLARQAQVSGIVQMNIVVGKDGKVLSVTPVSGEALLLQSASDAVKQWAAAKAAPCTLGKVDFQDQGTMLIGSVPYTYSGTSDLQSLAVRGVPLNASKQPIAGAKIAQSTLKAASGTASFSVEGHPALGKAGSDGEYILVAIVVKATSEVVCGEAVPYRHKW